jgi:CHAD domain-containing protein
LELFYPLAPKDSATELRKSIRRLTRILGGLRNIDEALLFFRPRTKTDISADDRLFHSLTEMRARELKRIYKALKELDHRHLDRKIRELVSWLNDDRVKERINISIPAYFSEASISRYQPIHRLLEGSTSPEHRSSRNALRIAIKKWRYFFEIIAQVLDRDYTHILDLLKEYQSFLGRMNDITVFSVLLGTLELPSKEREYVTATLQAEDTRLLEGFSELVECRPLVYTFLR